MFNPCTATKKQKPAVMRAFVYYEEESLPLYYQNKRNNLINQFLIRTISLDTMKYAIPIMTDACMSPDQTPVDEQAIKARSDPSQSGSVHAGLFAFTSVLGISEGHLIHRGLTVQCLGLSYLT